MGRVFEKPLIVSAAVVLCLATEVHAQYFGRNKVQYDRHTTRVLATEHFDVYYSQEDAAAAATAGRLAERWHARLAKVFDHNLRGRQPIVLYGSHRRFEQTNVYSGLIEETTGGFTDSRKRRIVLPVAATLAETDHVLGHEIVHAFQFDISNQYRSPLFVPLWVIEGMAEYLSLGPDDPQTTMWMRDAVRSKKLPSIADLSSGRYFPYRWGAAVWAYLVEQFGADLPARSLKAKRDIRRRLKEITGRSIEELSAAWQASLREKYPVSSTDADGATLISSRGGGHLNLGASLSPDGNRIVYLSERDQFSMDLFLADATTGRTLRKLITTATNGDFESLQYLNSSGAWDASGSRFALATIKKGRPVLVVLGIDNPADRRDFPLPRLDEIYSPTWSPDGRRLALSAASGGATDLFVLDMETGAVKRLTEDVYADLQPAWSPDGRTIAFTTDRFTTNLVRLTFDGYGIGLLDVESGAITAVPTLGGASQFDPAWSPDGTSLFFVGDPGGRSDVYRLERSTGRFFRMTETATGVSGVTRIGPVLSVSSLTGTLAFNVFNNGGYDVHTLSADRLTGTAVDLATAPEVTAPAPATDVTANEVGPVAALSAMATEQAPRSYRPRLSLEAIGTPYFSAGGGAFGSYVSGGGSLLFGDLLGDQQLMTAVYVSSHLDESAFGAVYVNRKSRVNWGVTLEQVPELRFRTSAIQIDPDREHVIARDRERTVWTNRHLGGFAAYPLSRSRRVEISAGFTAISVEREMWNELISMTTGMMTERRTRSLPSELPVGVADAGVAFVGDTAVFGATGPMVGARYRFQTSANVGGLSYTSVLADYRRYLMPVRPYTIAVRLMHAGRYGGDAGDFRLHDAYLGSTSLVRGYGANTVARQLCRSGTTDCPMLNTLLANRIVAAKLELRVPLWSTITTTSRVRYGPLPVDAFLFADAGAGWGGEQRFGPGGSDGKVVRSVGAGVRANMAGLVFEVAAVRPLDLRGAGWAVAFNLRPGF
jgi:Omp85 superfamily domain/WD40-like Beta Propeller Repeat